MAEGGTPDRKWHFDGRPPTAGLEGDSSRGRIKGELELERWEQWAQGIIEKEDLLGDQTIGLRKS